MLSRVYYEVDYFKGKQPLSSIWSLNYLELTSTLVLVGLIFLWRQ